MSLFGDRPGLSIIVTSYRRLDALYDNLTSLLNQDLRDLAIEIIVINNAKEVQLAPSRFSRLGRLFRAHPEIKLVNSRHNWMIFMRYGLAYVAFYDTLLFLDDDIYFLDNDVVYDMYQTLAGLASYDIVSSWNTLWTAWSETELQYVNVTLWNAEVTQLTMTDTCGPGISMFNRALIMDERAQRYLISWSLPDAGDIALGLLANMLRGGTTYAMPMHGRADFGRQHKLRALHERPEFMSNRFRLFKDMLHNGYEPVIARAKLAVDSPEMQLIRDQEPTTHEW